MNPPAGPEGESSTAPHLAAPVTMSPETRAVVDAYARRAAPDRYALLQPDVWLAYQERQRAVLKLMARLGWHDLARRRLYEVGCGAGGNLLDFLRMGFRPEHLGGIELLPERFALARQVLPEALALACGDALQAPVADASLDVVYQGTVFSSLLAPDVKRRLADTMWRWLRPGGGVLWYDMRVDNPRNPDVRGLPQAQVAALFPAGRLRAQRLTLAPPLARIVSRWHPAAYTLANTLPPLRTHLLIWIQKAE